MQSQTTVPHRDSTQSLHNSREKCERGASDERNASPAKLTAELPSKVGSRVLLPHRTVSDLVERRSLHLMPMYK